MADGGTGFQALDSVVGVFEMLAPSGFIFAYNVTTRGPEFFHSTFPKKWQVEYESRGYAYADPVLLSSLTLPGDRRWSEVRLPDLRGVMTRARVFGLVYGAAFSRAVKGKRSVLSLARADRELADDEFRFVSDMITGLIEGFEAEFQVTFSVAELETLRRLRDGMAYADIATALNISVPTVKARVKKICTRLGASNATQAVAKALERKVI